MSIIEKYYQNGIASVLSEYEKYIADAETILPLEGKTLRQSIQEQAPYQSFYDQKKYELKTLKSLYKNEVVDKIKGELWKDMTKRSNIDLSTKDKEMFLLSEKKLCDSNTLLLMIEEAYYSIESICDAFRARGFAIKNLTELLLVSLDEKVL